MRPADTLPAIAALTLRHYEENADAFWAGTRDHDVSQNIAALCGALVGEPPFTLLDFGCGPGRDLKTLAALGHRAVGLEGVPRFAAMAREYSGCEVLLQDFFRLNLPQAAFDGIFANATLQHIPTAILPRVLTELRTALKPGGVLFASIPHGDDQEGWNNDRYSAYHSPARWRAYLAAAGYLEVLHYFRPTGLPRAEQRWFAGVWRVAQGEAESGLARPASVA